MKYFDAHCHVQFGPYDTDRDELIAQMRDEEIGGLVVGTNRGSSEAAIVLAEQYDHLYASVGLHPNDTEVFDYEAYKELAQHPKVVAIGECGLDNYRPLEPEKEKDRQRSVFRQHVQLAVETGKPLMIHARPSKGTMDAYEDALSIVEEAKREHPDLKGNFHFFVGDTVIAKRILALDFTMSFTAVLTFARDYDEVVRFVPLTHILSETDAPYVAPARRRGERNDPFSVRDVVSAIAEIRGDDEEVVRETICTNVQRVFGI